MPFTGKVGDTLYLSDSGGHHRYIILTQPNKNNKVVLVNFTSKKYWKEWIVTFNPSEDKALFKQKTTVNYADAQIVSVDKLIRRAKARPKSEYLFCSNMHTSRIIAGAFQSTLIPNEVLDELTRHYPQYLY
jgi:hypothetical protein